MDEYKIERIARDVIEKSGGYLTKENIKYVMDQLNLMNSEYDKKWEKHIYQETDELLVQTNTKCKCGRSVRVRQIGIDIELIN